ncbi:Ref family protein [Escherichia albertii]|uniref:Ref family protein n=1 Tax=Escherichia albertii TaxID=208962 RepID=UPI00074357C6|nr:Ref family protein [Escherichia albertii]
MKTIEQKIEQHRKWQKAARERAIARQREKLADPVWRESQYQKMRDTIDRRIANTLGALPCIACYMHGVISEEVSLHHISGRTAPGCHKKQLPLCRWHHQHAAPAEVRAKYPWLVPVHADGVVGGKKEFTLLNKSEMELLADAYEMANIMH